MALPAPGMAVHAIVSSHAALTSCPRCYCYLRRLGDPAEDGHGFCTDCVFQSPARQLSTAQRSSWNKTKDDHVEVSDPRATTVPCITNRYIPTVTDSSHLRQRQQHDFIALTVQLTKQHSSGCCGNKRLTGAAALCAAGLNRASTSVYADSSLLSSNNLSMNSCALEVVAIQPVLRVPFFPHLKLY